MLRSIGRAPPGPVTTAYSIPCWRECQITPDPATDRVEAATQINKHPATAAIVLIVNEDTPSRGQTAQGCRVVGAGDDGKRGARLRSGDPSRLRKYGLHSVGHAPSGACTGAQGGHKMDLSHATARIYV